MRIKHQPGTALATMLLFSLSLRAGAITLQSPSGKVSVEVRVNDAGRLTYTVNRDDTVLLEPSPLGISVNGKDLGMQVTLGPSEIGAIDETYPWRGFKSEALDRCNTLRLKVTHTETETTWFLEGRAYDDGFAFRYVVPGAGRRLVKGEATGWRLPAGSRLWYHYYTGGYEGIHERRALDNLPDQVTEKGRNKKPKDLTMAPPVTVELPDGTYAALTEANLVNYSGMTIGKGAHGLLNAVFEDDVKGWWLHDTISSPWRVIMTGPGLDELVNCDIVHNVCPPPDPELFPRGMNTEWIKPGRCLWQWWAYGDPGTRWDNQKQFIDYAAKLNCQYYLVDAGWENTRFGWQAEDGTSWAKLKELSDYAAAKGVGLFVWRPWRDGAQGPGIDTAEKRAEFFGKCEEIGIKGAKIDYMASESKAMLEFYEAASRAAAEHRMMINFHGANKPTGEARRWPNEMTREGIMGLEHNKWSAIPPLHYVTLPFTRYLAGHGDFTPTTFQPGMLKRTTEALQLASAMVFESPILCWADKPEVYLASPVVDIIRTMPPVWDETIVLPQSRLGETAAFAKRSGGDWYVGILNANEQRTMNIDLLFLEDGDYRAVLIRDAMDRAPSLAVERDRTFNRRDKLDIDVLPGGGFLGIFRPASPAGERASNIPTP